MLRLLVEFAKTIRRFLGFASLIVLGLVALVTWLFSNGSFDPLVQNFGRLPPEQFFELVLIILVMVFIVILAMIILSFVSTQPKSQVVNPCLFVIVHEDGDKTRGIERARVVLSLIPRPLEEISDSRGAVTFFFPLASKGKRFSLNAHKDGYQARRAINVVLKENALHYIPLVILGDNHEKRESVQIDEIVERTPKEPIETFLRDVSRDLLKQSGNRRTAYPLDMSFRELFEQGVYIAPMFSEIHSRSQFTINFDELVGTLRLGHNVLVMGNPGCGKSFLTYLVQRRFFSEENEIRQLCISIDLRLFINLVIEGNRHITSESLLQTLWATLYVEVYPFRSDERIHEELLFIVDGIDELSNNPSHVKALAPLLNTLQTMGTLLVTCRTREFEEVFTPVINPFMFDTIMTVKEWEVDVEFAEFLHRLETAGKYIGNGLLEQVKNSPSLATLVRRPLHARMLTFVAHPDMQLRSIAQLNGEYLRKYATVIDTRLINEDCLQAPETYDKWRNISWYVFENDLFVHDKVPYRVVQDSLESDRSLGKGCESKLLGPLFNFSQVFHSTQLQYLHYSFFEYFVAEFIAEGLIKSHYNNSMNVHRYLIKNLTPEIGHQLMMVINDTKQAEFGKWLAQIFRVINSTSNQTTRRVANNLIVYILGRVKEDVRDELWALLSIEIDDFLRNGLYWALCSKGDLLAVKEYLDEMSQNVHLAYLNRGYHLYYYGDIDRGKEPPYLDNDPSREWPNTYRRMVAFMSESDYHRRVAIGRRVLDLYTFLDLCQFRNQMISSEPEMKLVSTIFRAISDELSAGNHRNVVDMLDRKRTGVMTANGQIGYNEASDEKR